MGILKNLIFKKEDDDEGKKKEVKVPQESFTSKFPSSASSVPNTVTPTMSSSPSLGMAPITPDNPACAPHLDKIMGLYEQGFDGLNLDGYDFYEYFKAVIGAGVNNPAVYPMALSMAIAMDSKVTKESLISQSEFYVAEINKVHQTYSDNGSIKRQETLQAKGQEESMLTNELNGINTEIERLTTEKANKEAQLGLIDSKFAPTVTDIECKLMANDIAREKIVATISSVVNGIKNNIN
jgi:hypothetical protein